MPTSAPPDRYMPLHAAFGLLLIVYCVVGPRHEPWFDEAQAWLLARDSTLPALLAENLRYEGSPGLWHLLLWLLNRLAYPFAALWIVSCSLAAAGAWIVLYRSPFPIWLRIGIVFSYVFAYQYAVVARSYALDLVLIPRLAATYTRQAGQPLQTAVRLGLLANCNAHGFILSALLALDLLPRLRRGEGLPKRCNWMRRPAGAALIYGCFVLVAVWTAWPPGDASFPRPPLSLPGLGHAIVILTEAFIDRADVLSGTAPDFAAHVFGTVLTGLTLVCVGLLLKAAGKLALFCAMVAAFLAFSIVGYANLWHAGILYLAFVYCLWISWEHLPRLARARRQAARTAVAAIAALHLWYAAAALTRDFWRPYSAGPAAAQVIAAYRRSHPGALIAALGFKTFAMQPWFSANLFANYHDGAARPAHYQWKTSEPLAELPTFADWTALLRPGDYDVLILSVGNDRIADQAETYRAMARSFDYCLFDREPGALIWKTYALEPDMLLLFQHCGGNTAALAISARS